VIFYYFDVILFIRFYDAMIMPLRRNSMFMLIWHRLATYIFKKRDKTTVECDGTLKKDGYFCHIFPQILSFVL